MSSSTTSYASLITFKLGFLEKQRDQLNDLCRDTDEVLIDGKTWVESRDGSDLSFHELNTRIDQMMIFLTSKGLSGTSSDYRESPKQIPQEEMLSKEGASASELRETSTIRENLTRSGPTQSSAVGHETVPDYVKKMLSRIDMAETAISSLQSSVDNSSKANSEIQAMVETVTQREEEQSKQLADIEKKVKKMGKHSEGMKQQEKRVTCLEKEIETLKKGEKRVTALESEIQTVKKQEKRITSLENEMVTIPPQLHDLEERTFRKIDKVEKQVEVDIDMTYHVKSRTESLDTTVKDLSNRTDKNKSLIDALSTFRDDDHKKLESLEKKTRDIAIKVRRNKKTAEEKLDEVKTEYKMVCHIVANRLLPLERLRTILNQKIKGRDENVKKLGDVADKVTTLEKKMTDLENRSSTKVGFTAYLKNTTPVPDKGSTITSFTDVTCNYGNHFDTSTGVFTAPVSGLYAVYCTVVQSGDGVVIFNAKHMLANNSKKKWVCATRTKACGTSASGFGIVEMNHGDFLYVDVVKKEGDVKLDELASFSCFLID